MTDIQNLAKQMQEALMNTEEYKNVANAFQAVKEDQTAFSIFKQFQNFQMQMQQKVATGVQPTEQDQQLSQQLAFAAQNNPKMVALMTAEQKLNQFIGSLNGIIMQPLEKLYNS